MTIVDNLLQGACEFNDYVVDEFPGVQEWQLTKLRNGQFKLSVSVPPQFGEKIDIQITKSLDNVSDVR